MNQFFATTTLSKKRALEHAQEIKERIEGTSLIPGNETEQQTAHLLDVLLSIDKKLGIIITQNNTLLIRQEEHDSANRVGAPKKAVRGT